MTVVSYIMNDTSQARVTGKSISIGYDIKVDNVLCCTIRHDVAFANVSNKTYCYASGKYY